MPYLLEGLLRAYLCDDCTEPLSDVTVRIYRAIDRKPQVPVLTHVPEEKPEALTEEQVEEKRPLLLGEGRTDAEGRYRVAIDPQARYEGGPLEVDIRCTTVPRLRQDGRERKPVQFTAAVIDPAWQRAEGGATAQWSYTLPHWLWCFIRSLFDAWVICGRLTTCKGGIPISGALVRAFDADWLQDDALGQDTTDAGGHFRIDYTSAQFRKTPFSPWINAELTEGPDLYFKVFYGGNPVLEETQSDGRARGRENVGHCFCVRLCTDKVKVLACEVTGPVGCVHGTLDAGTGKILEAVTGTAAGTVFDHYELEVLWKGTLLIPGGVIYPDAGGNPDPAATQGSTPVVSGTLGFLDLQKMATHPGVNPVESTTFLVRVRVFGGGQTKLCWRFFNAAVGNVRIKTVGGGVAANTVPPAEPLMHGVLEASIGLGASVRGAADVFGCEGEKISRYRIWTRADPTFSLPEPADGAAFDPTGWTNITDITYTTDEEIETNRLDGLPDPDLLTRSGWGSQEICITWFGTDYCYDLPYLIPSSWATPASGKYSVLLEVIDTAGNTYYDIQRVWVDNESIVVTLTGIGGLLPCMDLYTKEQAAPNPFRVVAVEGTAWDPLIIAGNDAVPSSNFARYLIEFQKQGAAGWVTLVDSADPVPGRLDPVGVGTLVEWDLETVDAVANPLGLPADQLLNPNESCAYLVRLQAWDRTLLDDGSHSHYNQDFFPVKIINSPLP